MLRITLFCHYGGSVCQCGFFFTFLNQILSCTIFFQESALRQLCDMAKDGGEEGRCAIAEAGAIPMLIFQVQHVSSLASELAAKCLRFLCRSTNVMVTQAASSAIPFLVALLHEVIPVSA